MAAKGTAIATGAARIRHENEIARLGERVDRISSSTRGERQVEDTGRSAVDHDEQRIGGSLLEPDGLHEQALKSQPVTLVSHDLGAPQRRRVIRRVERGEFSRLGANLVELFGRMGVARSDEELPFFQEIEGARDFEPIRVGHRFARRAFDVDRKKAPCGALVRERVNETRVLRPAKGLEHPLVERRRDVSKATPVPRDNRNTVVADPVRLPVHGDEGDTPSIGRNARSAIEPGTAYQIPERLGFEIQSHQVGAKPSVRNLGRRLRAKRHPRRVGSHVEAIDVVCAFGQKIRLAAIRSQVI